MIEEKENNIKKLYFIKNKYLSMISICGLLFISSLFFYGCASVEFEPNKNSIKNVVDWAVLDAKIMSWKGETKASIVKAWGIPGAQMNLGLIEEQLEYITSEIIAETATTSYAISSSATTETKTSTHEKKSAISFYIKNNSITSISYEGFYDQLNKLCKSENPESNKSKEILNKYYLFLYRSGNDYITWKNVTTQMLYDFLLPLSENYEHKEVLLAYYEDQARNTFEHEYFRSQKNARSWVSICEDNLTRGVYHENIADVYTDVENMYCIENYLATVKVYREIFEKQ